MIFAPGGAAIGEGPGRPITDEIDRIDDRRFTRSVFAEDEDQRLVRVECNFGRRGCTAKSLQLDLLDSFIAHHPAPFAACHIQQSSGSNLPGWPCPRRAFVSCLRSLILKSIRLRPGQLRRSRLIVRWLCGWQASMTFSPSPENQFSVFSFQLSWNDLSIKLKTKN